MSGAKQPLLFTPMRVGTSAMQLRNRIIIPPMCMYSCTHGKMGAFHHMHVGSMATSGAGLVIVEATGVVPEGRITPQCAGLWDEETAAATKAVLDEVRQYSDTPIAVQLQHAGVKASHYCPFEQGKSGVIPPGHADGGWQRYAPSAIPFAPGDEPPTEMTQDDIKRVVEAFAAAAVRANAVGYDGVELHFAHGYLAHQFCSPWTNQRTDAYGGSLENRIRFPLEVFAAVRAAFPKEKPVWVRISATDWTREAGMDQGWDVDQAIVLCRRLKELGCELVHVSSGGATLKQQIPVAPGYQLGLARRIREEAGVQTIGVGCITEPTEAEMALATGQCDAVGVARQMLYNPRWPYEAAHRLGAKIPYAAPQFWRCEPAPHQRIFDQQ